MYRLLVADSDAMDQEAICEMLDWPAYGFDNIINAGSYAEAVDWALDQHPQIVLVDEELEGGKGYTLIEQLRKAGVEYAVLKNTMINLAVKDMGVDDIKAHLEGPTAVAFGMEDAVAPAKVLSDFIKKSKKMAIKCGVVDGAYIDDKGVEALANTPSREVLIARIMGSMMSSVSKFVYCVEAIRKKQAGEE